MLKDNDMRAVLINELNRTNTCDYRVIEELAVCDGDARVDVAVANDRLCGYEIKSDADTVNYSRRCREPVCRPEVCVNIRVCEDSLLG